MGIVTSVIGKLIRGHWGRVVPAIFKSAGGGDFGEPIKRLYWFGEKYATVTGAVLWGVGAGLETVCGGYPQWAWSCDASSWIVVAGQVLASVGLLRGATNSPWPVGADISAEDKR